MGCNAAIIEILDAATFMVDDPDFGKRLADVHANAVTVASCRHADERQVALFEMNSCEVVRLYGDDVSTEDFISAAKTVLERAGYSVRKKREQELKKSA